MDIYGLSLFLTLRPDDDDDDDDDDASSYLNTSLSKHGTEVAEETKEFLEAPNYHY